MDLASEAGGNCDLTARNERVVSDNGVVVLGYTDLPSRLAMQVSIIVVIRRHGVDTMLRPIAF